MQQLLKLAFAASLTGAASLFAQGVPTPVPRVGDPIFSMGQPARNQLYGAVLGLGGGLFSPGARVTLGAHHALFNPVSGLLGVTGEAFGEARGKGYGGLRIAATSRAIGLTAGLEQTFGKDDGLGLAFSWETAVRRGGILRNGTMLRLDWLTRGDGMVGVGISMPIAQKFAGRTRERVTAIRVNKEPETSPPAAGLIAASADLDLTRAAQAATQIAGFTNLFTQDAERTVLSSPTRDYPSVLAAYHASIASAFSAAAGDTVTGRKLARAGRVALLTDVLLPFNSSFGQAKKGDGIGGLTSAAQRSFVTWMRDSLQLDEMRRQRAGAVFTRLLSIVESLQADLARQWKDSRLIWLPLQLGLTADEFDDQTEVDDLIARAVGRPFSDQNGLAYLNSTELPLEIARTIFATRDYHVMWTHDFAGRRFSGTIDNIGYSMVADVYLPALTEAVKRYDSTGVFPVYIIMLDQYFYEPNDGRLWMTILENPLEAKMNALREDPEREQHLIERQIELRDAVANSKRLQAEKERGLDPKHVVKVHVNITYPADFAFRSHRIIPPLPFIPDNLMRDHRKIVFYDVNESDPYRGAMILMGVGIGEHYASPTWEDRGYRIRGPAALEARRALRRTLQRLGFPDDKIPLPLRATEVHAAEQAANNNDYIGRALQVHNVPGFGPKESSVGRAALYNLASPGSIIIAPDPLWLSETWAGMLAAAAARGSKVMIIAPAFANAPSPQAPLMAMSHDLMVRMLYLERLIAAQKSANDGELRVGLFAAEAQVTDAAGRAREIREGLQRAPWIRSIIPFDSATLAVLENVTVNGAANAPGATSLAKDEKPRAPQLHQKTQLIALPGAMTALLRQRGWSEALVHSIQVQTQQSAKFTEQLRYTTPDIDTAAMRANDALLTSFEQARSDAERSRVSFYFSVGTQNEDDRGLASDGEASVIVSGFHAAAGVVDLYNVMARSRWITTEAELDRYIPPPSSFMRRLVRWIKATL